MENQPEKVKIDIDSITNIPVQYPQTFITFCDENDLTPPKVDTGNGKALALMLNYPNNYFTRKECDAITLKFNIKLLILYNCLTNMNNGVLNVLMAEENIMLNILIKLLINVK